MTKGSSPTTMPEALSTPTTSTGSADSTAAPTAPTAVTRVIASIRRVPDRYRSFTTSDAEAGGVHRIPATLLAELLDAGLPHRMSQGAVLLDRWDLDNVRMTLRLRSPQRTAIGRMAQALEAGARVAELRRKVHIVGQCPEPGHEGDCGYELAPEARA